VKSCPAEKENLIFTVRNTATENRYEFSVASATGETERQNQRELC
jgi:hypothetical protein